VLKFTAASDATQKLNSSIFINIICVFVHYAGLQNAVHIGYGLINAILDQQVSFSSKTIFYVITKQCLPGIQPTTEWISGFVTPTLLKITQPKGRPHDLTCKRNIEARSRNHCCRRKAIRITHYEYVSAALNIQRANGMRRSKLSSAARPALQYLYTLSHKRHDFQQQQNY
jgi:hypothetical protein